MEYKVFGCKVNKFYLNKRLDYFRNKWEDNPNDFIIATCVVTDRAKSKWIKEAKQKLKEWKKMYLTGCGVFDKWKKMTDEYFYSIYPDLLPYKENIVLLWEDPYEDEVREVGKHQFREWVNIYTKKFIVIQNGCDSYCTFCLTIQKRWSSTNRPLEEIIEEINDFVSIWWKEIVITWINLAARWCTNTRKPEENKFSCLLEAILQQTDIERIRISSLGPEFLDDKFFQLMENPRFLPHFHFSIQSFSDSVLKLMNRNYDSKILDDVLTKIRKLNRPDKDLISIGADIIIWFPWETKKEFEKTVDAICKYNITKLHAFPFSAHVKWETVPARQLEQIPLEIKKDRIQKITQVADKVREQFISENKWIKHQILVEEKKNDKWRWWTGNYIDVELDWDYKRGEVVEIEL